MTHPHQYQGVTLDSVVLVLAAQIASSCRQGRQVICECNLHNETSVYMYC